MIYGHHLPERKVCVCLLVLCVSILCVCSDGWGEATAVLAPGRLRLLTVWRDPLCKLLGPTLSPHRHANLIQICVNSQTHHSVRLFVFKIVESLKPHLSHRGETAPRTAEGIDDTKGETQKEADVMEEAGKRVLRGWKGDSGEEMTRQSNDDTDH